MATARTAALAVANIVTLATVPYDRKLVMSSITIDNQGAALHTIHFEDDFSADPSVGNPSGSAQTIQKAQYSVGAGLTAVIKEDELKDKEFLGTLKCYADSAEPFCIITVDYKYI
jgi:hypothetical protein